ncbi:type II toxin-antitoxin system Phd/YefM family antitoxin [Pseudomonas luteola]
MDIVNVSTARKNFKHVLDNVCETHEPTVITGPKGKSVVVMSQSDYNGHLETLHLLSSSANSKRLKEAIAQLKASKAIKKELSSNETSAFRSRVDELINETLHSRLG